MANRFDIHIQTLLEADQRQTFKFMTFGFNPTIGVKGFQMLVNMWLKCFLTPRGSDPTDLNYGTEFSDLIGSNVALEDARDVVLLAVNDCNEQLVSFQSEDLTYTRSELLDSAEIIGFQEDASQPGFSVSIEIKNQAQERLEVNLPILSNE